MNSFVVMQTKHGAPGQMRPEVTTTYCKSRRRSSERQRFPRQDSHTITRSSNTGVRHVSRAAWLSMPKQSRNAAASGLLGTA